MEVRRGGNWGYWLGCWSGEGGGWSFLVRGGDVMSMVMVGDGWFSRVSGRELAYLPDLLVLRVLLMNLIQFIFVPSM